MTATYCPVCDKAGACFHSPRRRYEDPYRPMALTPVDTEAGNHVRLEAIRFLGNRFKALLERSKTFAFSEIEGQHMVELERVIGTLEGMAPTGPLIATPHGGLAFDAVT